VELDGRRDDAIIWSFIKEQLILPYVDIELDYYDLGIENRDATRTISDVDSGQRDQAPRVGVKLRDDHA